MAVLVIWYYHKSKKAHQAREDERLRRMQSRRKAMEMEQTARRNKSVARKSAAVGITTPDKVWSARRQHARKKVNSKQISEDAELKAIQASYLGPLESDRPGESDSGSISDQQASELDYVGFDEYTARQRAKAAEGEHGDLGEFSMTAVKYESSEETEEEEVPSAKRAGFKP